MPVAPISQSGKGAYRRAAILLRTRRRRRCQTLFPAIRLANADEQPGSTRQAHDDNLHHTRRHPTDPGPNGIRVDTGALPTRRRDHCAAGDAAAGLHHPIFTQHDAPLREPRHPLR